MTFEFDIPAQSLEAAVLRYAQQAGVQVFFDSARFAGLNSQAVQGQLDARQALQQMLAGLPVGYRFEGSQRVTLRRLQSGEGAELAPLLIQARPLSERDALAMLPRSASVIEREEIERQPVRHTADLLQNSAGVYTAVSQQDPGTSVNIRGIQDFGRVNLSIDGMRQNYQQTSDQQRNGTLYIDPELLSGVLLEKGPSSALGGAAVIGGVADFRTLQASDFLAPGKDIGGRLRATTGLGGDANGNHFIGSGVFAAGNAQGDLLLAVSERHLGEYRAGSHGEIGELRTFGFAPDADMRDRLKGEKVASSDYRMRSQMAKLGWNLAPDQRLQLSYLQSSLHYQDAYQFDPYAVDSDFWPTQGSSVLDTSSLGLDYRYDPDSPLLDLRVKVYRVNTRNDQHITGAEPAYRVRYQTRTYGLQLDNTSRFEVGETDTASFDYGLETVWDRTDPHGDGEGDYAAVPGATPEGRRTLASPFASLEYQHDDWLTLSAGLRYDHYWLNGDARYETYGAQVNQDEGRFSPTFGVAIKPGLEGLQLFANWGKGWRPPAITETLARGGRIGGVYGGAPEVQPIYPNPALKPERSTSWEVGANLLRDDLWLDGDRLSAKVAYFDTRVENFIYFSNLLAAPDSPWSEGGGYVNNQRGARFRGVEYSLSYDAGSFYGDLSYTHMIGKNDFCTDRNVLAPESWSDQVCSIQGSAEHLPMDRGALTLGLRPLERRLDLGMRMRYSQGFAKKGEAALDEYNYAPDWVHYTVYDLFARLQVSESLSLGLAMDNVTDRAYLVPLGDVVAFTLQPGRTLEGTLEYRF